MTRHREVVDEASRAVALAVEPHVWGTSDSDTLAIARRIASIALPRVLEIGAFEGRRTRILAEAAASRGGTVVVIDPMRWDPEDVELARRRSTHAWSWLGALDRMMAGTSYETQFWANVGGRADSVRLFRGLSTARALIDSEEPCLAELDVLVLDGDHAYDAARSDLTEWASRVRPGGTVYVYDAAPQFRGLLRALAEHAASHDVTVVYPLDGSLALIDVQLRAVTHRGPRRLVPKVR